MKTKHLPGSALGEDGLLAHFYFSVLNFSVYIVWQVRAGWQEAIMQSCDAALRIRAIFKFGPQKEPLRIRGNPRSGSGFGSGCASFGFRISFEFRISVFGFQLLLRSFKPEKNAS